MRKVNKWFIDFLKTFKEGESRISEKQYNIFTKYLKNRYETDYTEVYIDTVAGYKVKVYEWACITGIRYYIFKEKVKEA